MGEIDQYIGKFYSFALYLTLYHMNPDPKMLFQFFSSLHQKDGFELKFQRASPDSGEIGDAPYFYVTDESGARDRDIAKYLDVERTAMGAWQLYHLVNASFLLFWYGKHETREYVFREEDLWEEEIAVEIQGYCNDPLKLLSAKDISVITGQYKLAPEVTIIQDTGELFSAEIRCCYWNDSVGLVRDCGIVEIIDGKASVRNHPDGAAVIYKYDYGMCAGNA